MKKTYATSLPDHIGAFLKASRCFAALGINITRVSYDKAVDAHMLFLDVEGTPDQLRMADAALERIGYLQDITDESSIVLLQFDLRDRPGEVNAVLKLIQDFNFNISYINAQGGETAMQQFRVGIYVEDQGRFNEFLEQAEGLCRVQVIEYNPSARAYDNSIFYSTFVRGVSRLLDLTPTQKQDLLVYSNLAMQTLDQRGLLPYRTFDSISRFAELLSRHRGAGFEPFYPGDQYVDWIGMSTYHNTDYKTTIAGTPICEQTFENIPDATELTYTPSVEIGPGEYLFLIHNPVDAKNSGIGIYNQQASNLGDSRFIEGFLNGKSNNRVGPAAYFVIYLPAAEE